MKTIEQFWFEFTEKIIFQNNVRMLGCSEMARRKWAIH